MTSTNIHIGFGEGKNSSKVLRPPGGGHSDIFGVRDSQNNGLFTPSKRQHASSSSISTCFNMVDEDPKFIRNGSTPTTPEKANNILNGNGDITPQNNGHAENGHQNGFSDENKSPLKQNGELNGKTMVDGTNGTTNGINIATPSRLKNRVPPGGYSSGLW